MTGIWHMSGIIIYAGLTACTRLRQSCVEGAEPFFFFLTSTHWGWDADDVILTLTKRGLSQPPEAWGDEGLCDCGEEPVKRVYRLENCKWMDRLSLDAGEMLRQRKGCWGADHRARVQKAPLGMLCEQRKASLLHPGVTDCFVFLKLKEAVSEAGTLQKITLFKQLLIESGNRNTKSLTYRPLLTRRSISGGHRRGQICNHELAPGALTALV